MLFQAASLIALLAPTVLGTNILLTNDDGWAVAIIRAQFEALTLAGYNVRSFLFQQHRLLTATQGDLILTRGRQVWHLLQYHHANASHVSLRVRHLS